MKKRAVWQIIFEFLSIVFAVLLALGLNAFKQNADLQNEAEFLTQKIILECNRNQMELDTVFTQNKEFKVYLDSLQSLDKIQGNFQISIASELLTKSAWDFTKASRSFSYLDENFLNDAAELYEKQDYYMLISNQMFQNMGELLISNPAPEETVKISNYYLLNLNTTADDLFKTYKNFLKKYQSLEPID